MLSMQRTSEHYQKYLIHSRIRTFTRHGPCSLVPCSSQLDWQAQDKSSNIEQQPPFNDGKIKQHKTSKEGGGGAKQTGTSVHPTAVSETNSLSGMLIILTKTQTIVIPK